ncbi:MAG: hypothetical protein WKG06_03045 [Segetibacter sp.]
MTATEKSDPNTKQSSYFKASAMSKFFDFGSLFIIGFSFLLFLWSAYSILSTPVTKNQKDLIFENSTTSPFDNTVLKSKADSIMFNIHNENRALRDSVMSLNLKLENIKIQNEDDEKKLRATGIIVAIIFAITGFFGIKSLNEIREYSLKNAQIDSKEAAKEKAEEVATKIAEEISKDVAAETAKQEAQVIAKDRAEETAKTVSERVARTTTEDLVTNRIAEFRSEITELRRFIELIRDNDLLKAELTRKTGQDMMRVTPAVSADSPSVQGDNAPNATPEGPETLEVIEGNKDIAALSNDQTFGENPGTEENIRDND